MSDSIREYIEEDVLSRARKRIRLIFDNFNSIIVSVSSGKDSTALYSLAMEEAKERRRKIKVFFLDQEAEYSGSIELIKQMMSHEYVEPLWYQVPIRLTNSTSYKEDIFKAWGLGEIWLREKDPMAIHKIEGKYPDRFYTFISWVEKNNKDTAFLVGLRTEESFNRLRAVIQNPGWKNIKWSTKTRYEGTHRFYPIYDWGMGDVWKYISDYKIPYNRIYDKMFMANKNFHKSMRVSNLIHEKSFKCLRDLQIYEPDTFNRLLKRLSGIHVASLYADDDQIFNAKKLPPSFKSWVDFRDYLLNTTPIKKKKLLLDRFKDHPCDEEMHRRQVRQILMNDYENNLDVHISGFKSEKEKREKLKREWWDIL